jgi:triosephosphate isomerase (TIM)
MISKSTARKPMVAGNWKMNTDRHEAKALAKSILDSAGRIYKVDIVLCPPSLWLHDVEKVIRDSRIGLGAQNLHWEEKGAFTGEISAPMLKSSNCKYVIIGHSERRQYFGENDETVNKKIKAAQAFGLIPIVCLGETLNQRETNETNQIITAQFENGLKNVGNFNDLVIAYEPVWAIGTGKNATPEQAQEVHKLLRDLLKNKTSSYESIRILYGGSAKPENAATLYGKDDIDGFLVGGASLKAVDFTAIIKALEV